MCAKQGAAKRKKLVNGFKPEFRETVELNERLNREAKCLCSNTENINLLKKNENSIPTSQRKVFHHKD